MGWLDSLRGGRDTGSEGATYKDGELSVLRHQVGELMGHPDHQHHWEHARQQLIG